jgi:hypothetical protein
VIESDRERGRKYEKVAASLTFRGRKKKILARLENAAGCGHGDEQWFEGTPRGGSPTPGISRPTL